MTMIASAVHRAQWAVVCADRFNGKKLTTIGQAAAVTGFAVHTTRAELPIEPFDLRVSCADTSSPEATAIAFREATPRGTRLRLRDCFQAIVIGTGSDNGLWSQRYLDDGSMCTPNEAAYASRAYASVPGDIAGAANFSRDTLDRLKEGMAKGPIGAVRAFAERIRAAQAVSECVTTAMDAALLVVQADGSVGAFTLTGEAADVLRNEVEFEPAVRRPLELFSVPPGKLDQPRLRQRAHSLALAAYTCSPAVASSVCRDWWAIIDEEVGPMSALTLERV